MLKLSARLRDNDVNGDDLNVQAVTIPCGSVFVATLRPFPLVRPLGVVRQNGANRIKESPVKAVRIIVRVLVMLVRNVTGLERFVFYVSGLLLRGNVILKGNVVLYLRFLYREVILVSFDLVSPVGRESRLNVIKASLKSRDIRLVEWFLLLPSRFLKAVVL